MTQPDQPREENAAPPSEGDRSNSPRARFLGLTLGPLAAIATYAALSGAAGEQLDHAGKAVAALGVLMAVLWITEALPIAATALVPVALFPLATGGEISIAQAASPYGNGLIFLFMGGFLIALSMQKWGLHRRIALHTIRLVGTEPRHLVGGFMLAAAFLSMWVSNTATVVMMLPIAVSVIELVRREWQRQGDPGLAKPGEPFPFAICLLLGMAYASSIGGIATLIGTPPNALLAAYVQKNLGREVSFAAWMAVGTPLAAVFLPIVWLLLTRVIYPIRIGRIEGGRSLVADLCRSLGPMQRGERMVSIVFVMTALAWITRPWLARIEPVDGWFPLKGLTDPGIAMTAGVALFALPVHPGRGVYLLDWDTAKALPWNILILFGGGLSLASAVESTGVATFIGSHVGTLHHWPTPLLVVLVTAAVVFLTELTSNTATTATLLPVLAAVAVGLGSDPYLLLIPLAIGASCAFMMPVATPPNAVVFASGHITIAQMCRAGLWLNLIGIGLIVALTYWLAIPILAV